MKPMNKQEYLDSIRAHKDSERTVIIAKHRVEICDKQRHRLQVGNALIETTDPDKWIKTYGKEVKIL